MKKKILASAAVGAAGLVALTGAAFAKTDNVDTSATFEARVADILGISVDQLDSAMTQARSEERDAQLSDRLAQAVTDGTITQDEADAVTAWFDARPSFVDEVGGPGAPGRGLGLGLWLQADSTRYEQLLQRLIDDGTITEDQAQAFRDWVAAAPTDVLDKLAPQDLGGPMLGGHMMGRGPGGRLFEGRFELRPYAPGGANQGGADSGSSASSSGAVDGSAA